MQMIQQAVTGVDTAQLRAEGLERPRRKLRVAAVYSHPIQYVVPFLRELGSRTDEVDLTVFYLSRKGLDVSFDPLFQSQFKWDVPLLEGYKSEFIPNLRRSGANVKGFWSLLNVDVGKAIWENHFDAIWVHGYEHAAKWISFLACWASGTPVVLRGESHGNKPRSWQRRAVKSVLLRSAFRLMDGFAYIGTLNRDYYRSYGVPVDRLFFCPYVVDNRFFLAARQASLAKRAEVRARLGVTDGSPVIVSAGKLYDVKQPLRLLDAFEELRSKCTCNLVFVGDGPLRPKLEHEIGSRGIRNVTITGFVNQTEIPDMYVAADIVVLPSYRETWGLTVNEAMLFELPVVVTDRVGCAPDLVSSGVNGFVVPHGDTAALSDALGKLVRNPSLRAAFGAQSAMIIANWGVKQAADGMIAALRACSKGSRNRQML
jgi:glycosyltransferase involved in cell wall biosynthesis